jgi:arsenate reductase
MNLSFKRTPKGKTKETVIFMCIKNAARRQMTEDFFRKYAPDNIYEAISVGTRHRSQIIPLAVQIMKDIGMDISKLKPKEMTEGVVRNAAKIINLGMDKNFCLAFFVNKVVD